MGRRILFLDIGGVLNSEQYMWRHRHEPIFGERPLIDPVGVRHLNEIIRRSGAEVVLSSTWREITTVEDMTAHLKLHGFESMIIDRTPGYSQGETVTTSPSSWIRDRNRWVRGDEIQTWLNNHVDVTDFVILDDDDDMEHLKMHWMWTDWRFGLQEHHVKPALKILGVEYEP